MKLTLLTPPVEEPITPEGVKDYLRLPPDTKETYLNNLISAARAYVEGITGRALLKQLWEMKLKPPFPRKSPLIERQYSHLSIRLPHPPLMSVETVTLYELPIPYTVEEDAVILSTSCWEKNITITFWAGYGEIRSRLPPNLTMGTLMATRLFEDHSPVDLSILNPFKVFHII